MTNYVVMVSLHVYVCMCMRACVCYILLVIVFINEIHIKENMENFFIYRKRAKWHASLANPKLIMQTGLAFLPPIFQLHTFKT